MNGFEFDFMTMQDHFYKVGQQEPNLEDKARMKRIIKLLYQNHIHDEDGWEVAEAAYQKGKASLSE